MRARHPQSLLTVLLVAVAALALLGCTGCDDHLVGLHDVVLRYAASGASVSPDDLRERVAVRLAAADLTTEVDAARSGHVTVRVDEEFAGDVRKLLTWQGGLTVGVIDGTMESAEVRAGAEPVDPPGRRLVSDRRGYREESARARSGEHARTRAVAWPPVAQMDTEGATALGAGIVVPLLPDAEAALVAFASQSPGASVAVVRDRSIVAVLDRVVVEDHRLVVPLGTSIAAYTVAADLARVLATPKLPALSEVSRARARPDWLLASANLVLPFVVSFAWLFFVRRFDRAQPEPLWLVFATFALGALAVVPAGLVEWGWDTLSDYTNPTLLTFGRSARAFPVALLGFIVTVGVTEEGCKLLATWSLATHRREFDEPVDGMVYGAAAALGFAAAENVRYLALGRVAGALVASRAFMSVPAHLFFGTIWGYALGRRLVEPRRRVWPLFLVAVSLHGLFDTLLSIDGGLPWAMLVGLVVASIFVVHLRLALRHGAVVPEEGPLSLRARGPRELFRMGSLAVFAAFVAAVYLFSSAMFILTLFEHSGRAALTLGTLSALVLGLLGWAARGVAATLPLDVVIDDMGVTFAGAAILYRDVVRIERRRLVGSPRRQEQMLIVGATRRLILGPASPDTLDALSHALAMRLSSVALR